MRARAIVIAILLLAPLAVATSAEWSRLDFHFTGGAGEWVVLYHPLPEPSRDMQYGFEVVVQTTGASVAASHVLLAPPTPIGPDGAGRDAAVGPRLVRAAPGEAAVLRESFGVRQFSDTPLTGFFAAATADAPWNVTLRIHLQRPGPAVAPETVVSGGGTVMLAHAPHERRAAAGGAATFAEAFHRPGWTHVQVQAERSPVAARAFDVAFPGGDSYTSGGARVITPGPFAIGTGVNLVDAVGVFRDGPGDFRATVAAAEAAGSVSVVVAHVPVPWGEMPDHVDSGIYRTHRVPFW